MKLKEFYVDYRPPLDYLRHIRDVVERLDPELIEGLGLTLLRNSGSVGRREARKKLASGGSLHSVQGVYFRAWRGQKARIELFVDKILGQWPGWVTRVPVLRYYIVTHVFFHELGHHVYATQNPAAPPSETVSARIGSQMAGAYFRRRYWPLVPFLYIVKKVGDGMIWLFRDRGDGRP